MNTLRVATVVIGAIGAAVGMAKALISIAMWTTVGIIGGGLSTNSYLHIVFGSNALIAASCALALGGAVLAARGRPLRGAALLGAGAAGVVGAVVLYVALLPVLVPPPAYTNAFYYVVSLAPVPLLLVAATLSLFVGRQEA